MKAEEDRLRWGGAGSGEILAWRCLTYPATLYGDEVLRDFYDVEGEEEGGGGVLMPVCCAPSDVQPRIHLIHGHKVDPWPWTIHSNPYGLED